MAYTRMHPVLACENLTMIGVLAIECDDLLITLHSQAIKRGSEKFKQIRICVQKNKKRG